jgi:flagellar biosynthesis protein FliP
VIAMLHYDDIRVKKVYKRMNLVSFIMLVVFIFTSPFLVDLGEKFAAFQSRRIASSEKPQNLPGITIFSNKKQKRPMTMEDLLLILVFPFVPSTLIIVCDFLCCVVIRKRLGPQFLPGLAQAVHLIGLPLIFLLGFEISNSRQEASLHA